jgi:hypothetical protein
MTKYRKKPIVIEAMQFIGANGGEVIRWADRGAVTDIDGGSLAIHTREGVMQASIGDWIIRGVKGEYYPCKPDIFTVTYEAVED